jgi:hypothetical protein
MNKWTILKDDEPYVHSLTGKKQRKVIAQCECGVIKSVMYNYIKSGRSKSCGCYSIELLKERRIKHSLSNSSEYRSWLSMKTRCTNPNLKQWKDYGGRGITVCPEWLNSFQNFYNDMGKRPDGKTLDRINNNKGYEPSNCRWATSKEQTQNRRKRD